MADLEVFSFDKGIVIDAKSTLLLTDGELQAASNFNYLQDGVMEAREPRTKKNTTAYGSIHFLERYMNQVLMADGTTVRSRWDMDGYCGLYTPSNYNYTTVGSLLSSARIRTANYGGFQFLVNGSDSKAYPGIYGAGGATNLLDWTIPNPDIEPMGTAGASGNPTGVQYLYYTFYVLFPNGRVYESCVSPVGTVTVTSQKVEWANIRPCPYSGAGVTIYRRLYRSSATLAQIYYVTTIKDNTTTTYSDNDTDATLELNGICGSEDYGPVASGLIDIADHLHRIFGIKENALYWSEPFMPFAFPSANNTTVSKEGDNLTSVVRWGDQLFMSTHDTWYRLQGNTSDSWAIKNTFAANGAINAHTVATSKYGIIGLWYDGFYLFDGNLNKNLTKDKVKKTFFDDTISDLSACYATFDGTRYRFFYPTSGTTISEHLVIDFTDYPTIKIHTDEFIPTAHHYDTQHGIHYWGKSDGYEYQTGTTETIPISLQTGDRPIKNIFQLKETEYLYYDADTNGEDMTVTIYADGVAQGPTITINTSSRTRKRLLIPRFQGYYFSLKIDIASAQGAVVYSPWGMTFNTAGV